MKEPVDAVIQVIDMSGNATTSGFVNCLDLSPTTVFANASVHYRGQSSLGFVKHQFGVKLVPDDEYGLSGPLPTKSFLDFPLGRTFVLNGPWIDGSLMRNHLAHWLYRGTGRYSPRSKHVVVLTRAKDKRLTYHGVYLALEHISYEPDEHRVALARLDAACRSPEELSGGWAWQYNPLDYGAIAPNLEMDKYQLAFGSGVRPQLVHPKGEVLTPRIRDFFVDKESGPLPRLYRFLYENMTSPDELEDVLDLGSFVDYLLHTELSQNTDAYRKSLYFFQDRGGTVNAGPVWDFHLAYGKGNNSPAWLYSQFPLWARVLCNYRVAALVPQRWRHLRSTVWSDDKLDEFLTSSAKPLQRQLDELCSDARGWTSNAMGCAHVQTSGSFASHVTTLKSAVLARAHWMDARLKHGHLFSALDGAKCGGLPDTEAKLPKFNCASDGDDSSCLDDPEPYIARVSFPAVRNRSLQREDLECLCHDYGDWVDPADDPGVAYCWVSMGTEPGIGLTPYCSGHGMCPAGPGATCICTDGREPPSCAATKNEAEATATRVQWTWLMSLAALWLLLFVAAAVCMTVVAAWVRRRRYHRQQQQGSASDEAANLQRVNLEPIASYGATYPALHVRG